MKEFAVLHRTRSVAIIAPNLSGLLCGAAYPHTRSAFSWSAISAEFDLCGLNSGRQRPFWHILIVSL